MTFFRRKRSDTVAAATSAIEASAQSERAEAVASEVAEQPGQRLHGATAVEAAAEGPRRPRTARLGGSFAGTGGPSVPRDASEAPLACVSSSAGDDSSAAPSRSRASAVKRVLDELGHDALPRHDVDERRSRGAAPGRARSRSERAEVR